MKYVVTSLKMFALAATVVVAAAPAAAQETVRWGIPMAFGSNLTALGDTMPWVSEQLKKVSGGAVNLQIFEPGKLVPALGIFEAVSTGKVEAGYSWMGYESGKVPASQLFGALPFGMESPQFAAWIYFGGGDALLKETFKPHTSIRSSAAPSAPRRRAGSGRRSRPLMT